MRTALILALGALCFLWAGVGGAVTLTESAARDLFIKANAEYQQQHYPEARNLYQQIIEGGIESAPVYYNMANSCARLGKTGDAVVNYERALNLTPRDADAASNLRRIEPAGNISVGFSPSAPLRWVKNHASLREWVAIFLTLFLLAGLTGGLWLAHVAPHRYSAVLRYLFFGLGLAALVTGLFAGSRLYDDAYVQYCVVMKPSVPILSGPGPSFTQIISAPEGLKVRRLSFNDPAWAQVVLADGQKGFVQAADIQPI